MQEFNPECTINLYLESRGKPAKSAWCCSLTGESGARILVATKFLGKAPFEGSVVGALHFGLAQATRLRMEKVHLATDLPVEGVIAPEKKTRPRDAALEPVMRECADAWAAFRLRKLKKLPVDERDFLRNEAEKFFKRGG